jgi:hypothetical protein
MTLIAYLQTLGLDDHCESFQVLFSDLEVLVPEVPEVRMVFDRCDRARIGTLNRLS